MVTSGKRHDLEAALVRQSRLENFERLLGLAFSDTKSPCQILKGHGGVCHEQQGFKGLDDVHKTPLSMARWAWSKHSASPVVKLSRADESIVSI